MMFRKKPVVIEAMQFTQDAVPAIDEWITAHLGQAFGWQGDAGSGLTTALIIPTLEGEMRADPGDWIIRGVKGEFYPCKPDIFVATYEPVDESPPLPGPADYPVTKHGMTMHG